MNDESNPEPHGVPRELSGEATAVSGRQRKQLDRACVAVGQPVRATAVFYVEGTWPWYVGGGALGAGLLGGALGFLIGLGVAYVMTRLVLRGRAGGFGFITWLAVTATELHALQGSFWSARPRPDRRHESWPLDQVRVQIRRKRLTTAVTLSLPDQRQVRLESTSRKRTQAFLNALPSQLPSR
jgi:hypothetical protein